MFEGPVNLNLPPTRALYTVAEAVVLLNYSRSQVYELIRAGRLETVNEPGSAARPLKLGAHAVPR